MGIFDRFRHEKPDKKQEEKQNHKQDNIQDNKQERIKQFEETFFATIDEKRKEDPLIGAKVGSKQIYTQIVEGLKEADNKLNVDNLLLVCSGIAGMSCQMTVRKLAEQQKLPVKQVLILVECKNGKKYFMGDNLNHFLLERQLSVYNLVLGIYHHTAPEKTMPDMHNYVCACVENLGKDNYKLWDRVPEQDLKKTNLSFWEKSHVIAEKYCKTIEEIPVLYGLVLQNAMTDAMKVLDAEKVLDMALENILFSAKLNYFENLT